MMELVFGAAENTDCAVDEVREITEEGDFLADV